MRVDLVLRLEELPSSADDLQAGPLGVYPRLAVHHRSSRLVAEAPVTIHLKPLSFLCKQITTEVIIYY